MTWTNSVLAGLIGIVVSSCASSTSFVSSWKSPTAQPLQLKGTKVAAVVMMKNAENRQRAEDKLASEITKSGAEGIAMYKLLPEATVENETEAKAALEQANVQGLVVLHPTGAEQHQYISAEPGYNLYWNGYYAHGWGDPWSGDRVPAVNTVVTVDTRIYSLRQNQLVWAGESKTTNPSSVDDLVAELATATAGQLRDLGLLKN